MKVFTKAKWFIEDLVDSVESNCADKGLTPLADLNDAVVYSTASISKTAALTAEATYRTIEFVGNTPTHIKNSAEWFSTLLEESEEEKTAREEEEALRRELKLAKLKKEIEKQK